MGHKKWLVHYCIKMKAMPGLGNCETPRPGSPRLQTKSVVLKLKLHQNFLKRLLKHVALGLIPDYLIPGVLVRLIICISNKFPGITDSAGLRTMVGELLHMP